MRSADTCHNVFALCIDQVLAVEQVLAIAGIAAEAYTRCAGVAHIAEYHGHHANCRAPFVGYAFHLAIEDGAFVHPAAEHSADGTPELFHRVAWEIFSGLLLDGFLEEFHQFLQRLYAQVLVELHILFLLNLLDDGLERIYVLFVHRFHAENNVAVHLNEAAVAVVHKMRVVGLCHHALRNFVVQAEVEDGVHHTGH